MERMDAISHDEDRNFELFRDCLSAVLVERLSAPAPRNTTNGRKARKTKKPRRDIGPKLKTAGVVDGASGSSNPVQAGQADRDSHVDGHVHGGGSAGSEDRTARDPEPELKHGLGHEQDELERDGTIRTTRTTSGSTTAATPPTGSPTVQHAPENDAEELAEFVNYIASEIFATLPLNLRSLARDDDPTHPSSADDNTVLLQQLPLTASSVAALLLPSGGLDPTVSDSLAAYGVLAVAPSTSSSSTTTTTITKEASTSTPTPTTAADDHTYSDLEDQLHALLAPVLTPYITTLASPPKPALTRSQATVCEICGRDWINLTYHHLIPRFVHAKAVKRGWHREEDLQSVAWLCGACHRAVHRFADHEDLARNYYTVERLLAQEEIAAFAAWVGRLRWKKR